MPIPAPRQLLRRLALAFIVSFVSMTGILLANFAARQWPQVSERGDAAVTMAEVLLLAVPFTAALTMPMAVFVAVLWTFSRLGREGVLESARRERHAVRRLLMPVLGVAALISAITLVTNTLLIPRANARLSGVLRGGPPMPSDRTMSVGELRSAARDARDDVSPRAAARAASFEVEVHKKFALGAASLVLALAGAAIALLFPRGGVALVVGASSVVFSAYYATTVMGEALADRLVLPPAVAMWLANLVIVAAALFMLWLAGRRRESGRAGSLAVGA